jgi:putative Holliday junction resolvase
MKYLGIDYGTKRVGLATAEDGGMAFPLRVIPNRATLVLDVSDICIKEKIGTIVMGRSLNNNNEPNVLMKKITPFVEELKNTTGLPVVFMNEAFSSREAMHLQGDNSQNDASAACIVLQSYINSVNPSIGEVEDDE